MIVFNENRLLQYLIEYDYIREKYGIDKNNVNYINAAEHENICQSPDVVKRDYASIYENIRLVYGDEDKANRMMMIYKLVKDEFINKFLNIPGLERLYDEHFFEFEWDMHSRLDFDSHNISFYRDHFVHQVRNLFEMNSLLDNDVFFRESFLEDFLNGNNKVSAYVKQEVKAIMKGIEKSSFAEGFESWKRDDSPLSIERDYALYILKAAIVLCALFHDIGYPILHFSKLQSRISKFMPSMYMYLGDDGKNFEHIFSSLCNSLLFRVVPKEELRENVCKDNNHGAVSAVAFLLTFYENGTIRSLSADKRVAVEIAALAIYNHTIKYTLIEDEGKSYFAPKYKLNPLSYLLRICDDIQEWERTYFEITSESNIIMCEKCGMPLMRTKNNDKAFFYDMYEYKCHCEESKKLEYKSIQDYTRREIIDIINCKEVTIRFDNHARQGKKYMSIELDYDLAKLLKMCIIAPRYTKYRINDLKKTRKILDGQRLGDYDAVNLDFILTPNPFILKASIIGVVIDAATQPINHNTNNPFNNKDANISWHKKKKLFSSISLIYDNRVELKEAEAESPLPKLCKPDKANIDNLISLAERLKKITVSFDNVCKDLISEKLIEAIGNLEEKLIGFDENKKNYKDLDLSKKNKRIEEVDKASKCCCQEIINIKNNVFDSVWEMLNNLYETANNTVKSYIKQSYPVTGNLNDARVQNMAFYYMLYMISRFFILMNSDETKYKYWNYRNKKFSLKHAFENYFKEKLREKAKTIVGLDFEKYTDIGIFIDDAVEQFSKLFDNNKLCPHCLCTDDYYNQFKTKDQVYNAVERYSYPYSENDVYKNCKLDFYSDLHLYITLSDTIRYIKKLYDYFSNNEKFF